MSLHLLACLLLLSAPLAAQSSRAGASRPSPFEARLLEALGSDSAEQRAAAAFVLGRIGEARHVEALAPLIYDSDPRVRVHAVRALESWPSPQVGKVLVAAILDKDFEVSITALRALQPEFVPAPPEELAACLSSENGMVRSAAYLAAARLGYRGDPAKLVEDWDGQGRRNLLFMAEAFWWLDGKEHRHVLEKASTSQFPLVAYRAAQVLARLDPRAVPDDCQALLDQQHPPKLWETYLREARRDTQQLLRARCERVTREEFARAAVLAPLVVVGVEAGDTPGTERREVLLDALGPLPVARLVLAPQMKSRFAAAKHGLAAASVSELDSVDGALFPAADVELAADVRAQIGARTRMGLVVDSFRVFGDGHLRARLPKDTVTVLAGWWCCPSLDGLGGEVPARGQIWRSRADPQVFFVLAWDPWEDPPLATGTDLRALR